MIDASFTQVNAAYSGILSLPEVYIPHLGITQPVPKIPENLLLQLCHDAISELEKQPTLVEITGPAYVIGDVHGNLIDLIRILRAITFKPDNYIVFLGDTVDRGTFSLEVITIILATFLANPNKVVILRGNHECSEINGNYGFKEQITKYYSENSSLWEEYNKVFAYLPIACTINQRIFCIHGGISPDFKSLNQIRDLKRPIYSIEKDTMLYNVLWSDPHKNNGFIESLRAKSCSYGTDVLMRFLNDNSLGILVRGHQCVTNGVELFCYGKGLTVFSSSNYGNAKNKAGFLNISEACEINAEFLDILKAEKPEKIAYFKPVPEKQPLAKRNCCISIGRSSSLMKVAAHGTRKTKELLIPNQKILNRYSTHVSKNVRFTNVNPQFTHTPITSANFEPKYKESIINEFDNSASETF